MPPENSDNNSSLPSFPLPQQPSTGTQQLPFSQSLASGIPQNTTPAQLPTTTPKDSPKSPKKVLIITSIAGLFLVILITILLITINGGSAKQENDIKTALSLDSQSSTSYSKCFSQFGVNLLPKKLNSYSKTSEEIHDPANAPEPNKLGAKKREASAMYLNSSIGWSLRIDVADFLKYESIEYNLEKLTNQLNNQKPNEHIERKTIKGLDAFIAQVDKKANGSDQTIPVFELVTHIPNSNIRVLLSVFPFDASTKPINASHLESVFSDWLSEICST